jgi:hypothetical protein
VFEVKPVWTALHVQLVLKQPIMEWQHVPSRFFKLIYEELAGTLPISSKEFSAVPANQLSEVRAKYAVYGGASSVSLGADALQFDFPSLVAADQPVVQNILSRIHDAFPREFHELSYDKVSLQSHRHLEFVNAKDSPADYLSQFAPPKTTTELKSVVVQPGAKFELISEDQTWTCSVGAERSIPNARAVFVALNVTMNRVDPSTAYQEKAQVVLTIADMCHKLLGLEVMDAAP